jgi:tetratricopeptide (TPR) repeat protein
LRNAALPDTVAFRYQAFVSYSHADVRWAKWLHANLEGFHLGDDLVGRETARGRVPNALRPIFRDREEFAPGHSLSDQTRVALDTSAALIVICSPRAAKSDYVNEEIRLFKSRHAERLVIPLIVNDASDRAKPRCFPPALAFKVASDGTVSSTPEAILAADARKTGDGRDLALAKVVASLIGVPVDDVRKRQALTQSWWIKVTTAVVAVIAALAMVAVFLVWEHQHESRQLADIHALVENLASTGQVQGAETPSRKQAITGAVEAAEKGAAAGDTRLARALDLLKQGKVAEAAPLFRAVAEGREQASKAAGRDAAEAWRNLGAIAGLADPKKAREAYAHAVALDPENVQGLLWHGWLQKDAGNLLAAEEACHRVIAVESGTPPGHEIFWANLVLGDIAVARGDLSLGESSYIDAQKIVDRLAKADPNNAGWQFDLGLSNERIGNVQQAQGDLAAALKSYEAKRNIISRLAQTDPDNTGWQRDLSVSYDKVGEVQLVQGDLTKALKLYRDSLSIRDRLAKADPNSAAWQRDLSMSCNKIGDVQVAQGDLTGALKSYRDGLAIRDRLTKADPNNAAWQRDLAVSYDRIGSVQVARGDATEALKSYRDSLAITDRLAKANPKNAEWQRDLSVSYERIGDVQVVQGDLTGALKLYRDSLAIRDRLAQIDPNNAGWQRNLSVSYEKVGDVQVAQGDPTEALKSYRDSLAITDRLAKADPNNAEWQRDLAASYGRVGKLQAREGAHDAALKAFREARDIIVRLKAQSPGNARLPKDLAWLDEQITNLNR